NPDRTWAEPVDMLWRFKYIMDGMGIQDETLKADGKHSGSIRQFIPDSTRWYVHYYNSGTPTTLLPVWEGNKNEEDKIVLYREQKAPNGMDGFYRLSFYDMTEEGYKWVGEWVNSTESVVFPTWKIDCKKRAASKNDDDDSKAIVKAAAAFSKAVMEGDIKGIMSGYTQDAKIFPSNLNILSGKDLEHYWTPRNNGYTTIHHKITPTEIKFFGDYAHDYGHYEGKTQKPDGSIDEWKGKYVVIWKNEEGNWKMYLDIWNAIRPQPKS
ncbi:MAG: nuclear transport factor 2 family protein, partial [Bacteroidota bacterium]